MEGWVKLHRSSLDHWLYKEYRPLTKREAWENMLMWANYEDNSSLIKGQLIECKRGQLLYSLETYAQKFVWTIGQVRNFFELLKKDNMITVEGLKYTTRLTICNYDKYQDKQQTDNILTTDSEQTDDKLTTNSQQQVKNIKKEKKVKKEEDISPRSFYDDQLSLSNNDDHYLRFVKFLFGENELFRPLNSVLSIRDQISYKQYCELRMFASKNNCQIFPTVLSLENYKDTKKYVVFYTTLKNWLTPKK